MAAAMGIPRRPKRMLTNHWSWVRGVVLAKSPRNWTRMNWKMMVPARMHMKMEFCGKPLITLISSMSLELISLNTYMVYTDSALESYIVRKKKSHHYPVFPTLICSVPCPVL